MAPSVVAMVRPPRMPRQGRPDGSSEPGTYVGRWVDEDTGPHMAQVQAASEQDARDSLDPLVNNNTLIVKRVR